MFLFSENELVNQLFFDTIEEKPYIKKLNTASLDTRKVNTMRRSKRRTRLRRRVNILLMFANSLALLALFILLTNRFVGQQDLTAGNPNSQTATTEQVAQNQDINATSNSNVPASATWQTYTEPVKIPILMYHAIHDMDPSESASANLIVAPSDFEAQIKALSEAGYYFLSPEEAYRALTENALPAEKVVWLTFDDGDEDFYSQAYPILKKYQAKATNNIITSFVQNGNTGNLTIAQMTEMMKNGISFESHTVTHPDLSVTADSSQETEMEQSKAYLEKNLDTTVNTIAYPSGRYNSATLELAKQDYQLGLTTNEGLASANNGLLSLNRVRILPTTTADSLLSSITTTYR